jgi:transposase
VPDEPVPGDAAGLRAANARLRELLAGRDAEIALLRAELDAECELRRRLELRLAELERRLGMESTDSGTPSSKERTGAREATRVRQQSERERRKDRKRGGQPGHQGKVLATEPEPDERETAGPPAECPACGAGLDGAALAAKPRWARVTDIKVGRRVTEILLPGVSCLCCGTVTFAEPLLAHPAHPRLLVPDQELPGLRRRPRNRRGRRNPRRHRGKALAAATASNRLKPTHDTP